MQLADAFLYQTLVLRDRAAAIPAAIAEHLRSAAEENDPMRRFCPLRMSRTVEKNTCNFSNERRPSIQSRRVKRRDGGEMFKIVEGQISVMRA